MTEMNCPEARALIEKLADGEATEAESREARSHLAACAACRSDFELLTATARSLSSPLPEPPGGYFDALPGRVLARLDAEAPASVFRKLLAPEARRWEALAAVVLLAAAVGLVAQREGGLEPPASPASEAVAPSVTAPSSQEDERFSEDDVVEQQEAKVEDGAEADRPSPPPVAAAPAEAPPVARDQRERAASAEEAPVPAERRTLEAPETTSGDAVGRQERVDAGESKLAESRDAPARRLEKESFAPAAAALSEAAPGPEEDCERWRRYLEETVPEGESARDARYRLARCSIARFERGPTDALRATAMKDAEAFLEIEARGPRAEEIREALARLR